MKRWHCQNVLPLCCCCCSSNVNSPGQPVLHNPYSKHVIPLIKKKTMARIHMKQEIDAMLPDSVESESDPTYCLCIQ